jgi:hypothetical protein
VTATPGAIVFAAVHMGPYQSIEPLEARLGVPAVWAVDGIAQRAREGARRAVHGRRRDRRGGRRRQLPRARGRACRRAEHFRRRRGCESRGRARGGSGRAWHPGGDRRGLPRERRRAAAGARLDALCVETDATADLHVPAGRIHVTGNPRYDALRAVDAPARRTAMRAELELNDELLALWVGQPDAGDSYRTLEAVLPSLREAKTGLLFRAHPRDAAYASGRRYATLLAEAGISCRDVTAAPDVIGLCCAADLVVTQFSSVAVEAGYVGTPALFVLLPGSAAHI